MTTWLCRVMAAVFMLNILAPTDLLAQTNQPLPRPSSSNELSSEQIEEKIRARVAEKFAEDLAAAQLQYEDAKGAKELYYAVQNLHNVGGLICMEQRDAVELHRKLIKSEEERAALRQRFTEQAVSTYVAPRRFPATPLTSQEKKDILSPFEAYLASLEKAEDLNARLIEDLDPLGGCGYYTLEAAAILSNSVDSMKSEEARMPEMVDFLLELQVRAIHRLNALQGEVESYYDAIMMVGFLRSLLLKTDLLFKRAGIPNPLFEEYVSVSDENPHKKTPRKSAEPAVFRGLDGTFSLNIPGVSALSQVSKPKPFFSPDMYMDMMTEIMDELRAYKSKDLDEESKDDKVNYNKLLLSAQFAVLYAMDFQPETVTSMVQLFDKGAKETDFKQQYSSVLNAILTAVYEQVKFTPGESKHAEAIDMFLDFSDPEKYSIPTRIFALEMASLLYYPYSKGWNASVYKPENLFSKNIPQERKNSALIMTNMCVNTMQPYDRFRPIFARRTVDIYAPLNHTHYLAMKDYGLDSEQMKELADKLAYIYDGFSNDSLKWDTTREHEPRSYVLDKAKDGSSLILNDPNTSVPQLIGGDGRLGQYPNGDLHHFSGFGYCSDGFWVEMNFSNGINREKWTQEFRTSAVSLGLEALLWVFGGEIIGGVWRVARGATVALPRAVRAAYTANQGRRVISFGIEIQKSVRFQNALKTLRANGVTVTATRTEKVRKTANAAKAGSASTARGTASAAAPANAPRLAPAPTTATVSETPLLPAASEAAGAAASKPGWWARARSRFGSSSPKVEEPVTSPVTSMNTLRNRFGWWRGYRARNPIEEWSLMFHRPGFDIKVATLSGTRAARLSNGIHSYDELRYFLRNMRPAAGGPLNFTTPLKPWSSLWNGSFKPMFFGSQSSVAGIVQKEQRIMGATSRAFAQDAGKGVGEGVFDYWKYTENGWVRINQKEFMELGEGLQAAAKEAVPDYYAVMGLQRNASAQQIRSAYRKLASKLHPDKGGDPDSFRLLAEAWETLGNETSRAAYNAKLLAAPKNVSSVVLPQSPEGMSLAVTRNMGREIPEGFNPLTLQLNDVGWQNLEANEGFLWKYIGPDVLEKNAVQTGLGFNASNWGAVDVQLSKHLAATGQLDVIGSSLMLTDPLVSGFTGNMAFFTVWGGADKAVAPYMNEYIEAKSAEELEKMKKKHGDAYDPALMAEDKKAEEEALQERKKQGLNTASPSTYDQVLAAQKPESLGAVLTFPVIAGLQGSSKTELGKSLGIKSPFVSESTRTMLDIGARNIQISRAMRGYQKIKTQKDFEAFHDYFLTELKKQKTETLQWITLVSQIPDVGNLNPLRTEIVAYFDSVKHSVEQIAKSDGKVEEKSKELTNLWNSTQAKVSEFWDQLHLQAFAPNGEEEYFRRFIAAYKVGQENYVSQLATLGYKEEAEKMEKIYQDLLKKISKIQKKKVSFSEKYAEKLSAEEEAFRKIEKLTQDLPPAPPAAVTKSVDQQREEELQVIENLEQLLVEQGVHADDFFQEWREKAISYCNDLTYTAETLSMALQRLRASKMNELDMLILKAQKEQPSSEAAVPVEETGTSPSGELEELLPDETSEVFTGA